MVTASSPTVTYGGHVPGITASYSGFVNGDNASSLTTQPSCSTAATSSSPVGTYASTCSGAADPSYDITYVDGSVAVATAPLVVTASSGSMTYGGAVPTITSSDSGFVNGDNASSLTTQPTCSTTATSLSGVGTYPSSCSGASDPNYAVSYVNGVVAVGTATLVITASSGSMTYGGGVPSVTASYSGFENGDTASSLTKLPTCTTTATSSSGGRDIHHQLFGCRRPQLHDCLRGGRREGQLGQPHDHSLLGIHDLRRERAGRHRVVLGLCERRHRDLAHHEAHLLDDGHVVQPGGFLRHELLGCGRRQLRHHLRGGHGGNPPGQPHDHCVVCDRDLRKRRTDDHGDILGLRERRHSDLAHDEAHLHHSGHRHQHGRVLRLDVQRSGRWQLHHQLRVGEP